MEHSRIIQHVHAMTVTTASAVSARPLHVLDMMAGVGPFAVPIAMLNFNADRSKKKKDQKTPKSREVKVYANDLNPASYRYLLMNINQNHVDPYITALNQDGR